MISTLRAAFFGVFFRRLICGGYWGLFPSPLFSVLCHEPRRGTIPKSTGGSRHGALTLCSPLTSAPLRGNGKSSQEVLPWRGFGGFLNDHPPLSVSFSWRLSSWLP